MSSDNLIKIIAQEVLKRIKESQDGMDISNDETILILDNDSLENRNRYRDINCKGNRIKCLNEFHIDDLALCTCIIAPSLSNKDIASIALGLEQSEISKIIIEGILRGKKIIALDEGIEYKKFKETANSTFFKVFKEYEEKLIQFGIEILKKEELCRVFGDKNNKAVSGEAAINKKVITEKDIFDMYNRGYKIMYINKKSIITPLALDYIRLNGIDIART